MVNNFLRAQIKNYVIKVKLVAKVHTQIIILFVKMCMVYTENNRFSSLISSEFYYIVFYRGTREYTMHGKSKWKWTSKT
jgi:hypothetical protein